MSDARVPRGDGRRRDRPGSTASSTPAIAPAAARADLDGPSCTTATLEPIARGADADGNPVTGLVALLRERTAEADGPLAAPRADQPGRRRHRADAVPARRARPHRRRGRRPGRALAALAESTATHRCSPAP